MYVLSNKKNKSKIDPDPWGHTYGFNTGSEILSIRNGVYTSSYQAFGRELKNTKIFDVSQILSKLGAIQKSVFFA